MLKSALPRMLVPLVLLLAAAPAAPAQKLSAPADAAAKVGRVFEKYQRNDGPGCAVGVSLDGNPVLTAAYGMADLEHDVRLTPDSIFEAGSVSKQFTAAAVLLLAARGKLSLDDPVRKYIPELPEYPTPITIRQMLNHTSGLRDWGALASIEGWPRGSRAHTHAHVLEIAARQRVLNYPAGAEYSYCNTGYNLAAILVSRVAGKPFAEFTREAIFMPLGMTSTSWRDDFRRVVPRRAVAYSGSGPVFRQDMPFEDVHGQGGLLTTVGDLLLWNRNFTEAKVGGPALVAAQQERGRLTSGRAINYAAGLMMVKWMGLDEVSHSGATAGYRAWLGRYPDQGLSVAVLCNSAAANTSQLGHEVAKIYLGERVKSSAPAVTTLDAATLAARAGMYRSLRDHAAVSLEVDKGQLRMEGRGTLKAITADRFVLGGEGPRVEFTTDSGGRAVRMQVGDDNVYEKVERWAPTRADLEALAGEYASDEAAVTLRVAAESTGLVIYRRPGSRYSLRPTYRDGFQCPLGSVRFLRDAGGRATTLSLGESRVWDLRFERVR